MSHSAGFRAVDLAVGRRPAVASVRADVVGAAGRDAAVHRACSSRPGSKYSYSNPGVIFLGRIIELLSGDDYEVYVTKNILMPLGMRSTFFDRAPYYLLPHRSHSYLRDDGGLREARFDFDTGITVSNGGLNAPFDDMAKYLAFLIGDPARPDYEIVLKRSSLEEMWTPQIRAREGEGVNGNDSQAGAVVLRRAARRRRAGRPQRRSERLHLAPLSAPSVPDGLARLDQHRYDAVERRLAAWAPRQVDAAVRELMLKHMIR